MPTTYPLLATYWTDLYPLGSNEGYVYYKVNDQSALEKASQDVRTFANIPSFEAKWVLVVTWFNTPFYPKAYGQVSFCKITNKNKKKTQQENIIFYRLSLFINCFCLNIFFIK